MTEARRLRRHQRRAALGVLVDALVDGPEWVHLLPDAADRRSVLRRVVGVALADSGRHARVVERDGRVAGVAVWQPPGRYPMTRGRQLRALPRLLPAVTRLGSRFEDVRRLGEAVDAAFPAEPVRYLQALGVAPGLQRQGVGAALLADGLRTADDEGADTYLETGSEGNVAYYERHGFRLVEPGHPLVGGGAVMWRMRRPASAGEPPAGR